VRSTAGFFPKQADRPAQGVSIVIAVDNIDEAMKRVSKAGGQVLGQPMEIPGVGRYVAFRDPEGNQASILQPTRDNQQKKREQDQQWSSQQPGSRSDRHA
jgi:predicted enzyme related to lactoylglutathione lyase